MNLIMCGENCKYQEDGYCCLNVDGQSSPCANNGNSDCWYFQEKEIIDSSKHK